MSDLDLYVLSAALSANSAAQSAALIANSVVATEQYRTEALEAAASAAATAESVVDFRDSFSTAEAVGQSTPINPTSVLSASSDVWDKTFTTDKLVDRFQIYANGSGTVYFGIFTRSGDTFTEGTMQALTVSAGLNTFTNGIGGFTSFTLPAGQYCGVKYNNKSGRTTNTAYGTGFWSGSSGSTSWTDTVLTTNQRIEAGFRVSEQTVTATTFAGEQSDRLTNDRSIDRIIRNLDRAHRIIVPFGDSRAVQETQTTSVNMPVMNARGALEWAAIRTGHKIMCDPTQNYGSSGEITAQFLTRINTVKRCTAAAVWIPGWINDSAQNVATATTQANILSIVQQLRDVGKIVFLGDDYPSSTLTSPQMTAHVATRDYVRTLHNPAGGIYVVRSWDAIATTADGTTEKTNALADNLHPSTYGAFLISGALKTQVEAAYRDPDIIGSQAANLVTNPDMTGTGGTKFSGSTGSLADNWTTTGPTINGTGAVAFSKVTGSDGETWQQIAVSGTFSTTPAGITMSQDISSGSFTSGDLVEFMLRLEVDGPTVNMRSIVASIWYQSGQASGQSGYQSPAQYFPTDAYSGVLHSQFIWPAGHTRITPILSVNFQSTSPAVTLRVRDWQVRKIT